MEDKKISESSSTQQENTLSYIDNYCERQKQPDWLAEPLNLITNICFVIGAVMVLRMLRFYRQITKANWDILLLTFTLAVIGFGSAAYHSMPSHTTLLMDVLPITLFIHIYLVSFFVRVVGMKIIYAIMVLIAFFAAGQYFSAHFSPDTLNGTIMYVPTYLMLIVMVLILCFVKQSPLYLHLINTAVIWTFSLAFRTMDMDICSHTSHVGTHFLWHILNAVVLYRMLVLLIVDKVAKLKAA